MDFGIFGMHYRALLKSVSYRFGRVDKILLLLAGALIFFGWIATISISPAVAVKISAQKLSFVRKQGLFAVLGVLLILMFSVIEIDFLRYISFFALLFILVLLALMPIFATTIKGSRRWINVVGFSFQPSEILKPFFLVVNGFILRGFEGNDRHSRIRSGIFSSALLLVVLGLCLMQPDFGMSIIYFSSWLLQIFLAGLSPRLLFAMLGFVTGFLFFGLSLFDHVKFRINAFFLKDGTKMPYQVKTALESMANGGLFGTGIGEGEIKKYLPDAHSDYIFAAIGEEVGWIAAMILIGTYFIMISRSLKFFMNEPDKERRIIGMGIVGMLFTHIFASIGVSINLLPAKGTTLPFVSYGGSSMISFAILFGILLSLTKKELRFTNIFEVLKSRGFKICDNENKK